MLGRRKCAFPQIPRSKRTTQIPEYSKDSSRCSQVMLTEHFVLESKYDQRKIFHTATTAQNTNLKWRFLPVQQPLKAFYITRAILICSFITASTNFDSFLGNTSFSPLITTQPTFQILFYFIIQLCKKCPNNSQNEYKYTAIFG